MTRDAGPVKGGTTEIAFVEDNTGYKWELIQKPGDFLSKKRDPILHVRECHAVQNLEQVSMMRIINTPCLFPRPPCRVPLLCHRVGRPTTAAI